MKANAPIIVPILISDHFTHRDGRWHCAEVIGVESLGCGTYLIEVDSPLVLDPSVVFGMFTWTDACPHRELEIEAARWGDPANDNLPFVVQPFYLDGHLYRLSGAETAPTTHLIAWAEHEVNLRSLEGAYSAAAAPEDILAAWTFDRSAEVPQHADETLRLNLWWLSWRMLSTFDLAGFRVYRNLPDGSWGLVQSELVPVRASGQQPVSYEMHVLDWEARFHRAVLP